MRHPSPTSHARDERRLDASALARAVAIASLATGIWACGEAAEPEAIAPSSSGSEPPRLDAAEVQQLRALGYLDEVSPEQDRAPGVRIHDARRTQPGLTYYTNVRDCSSHLIDASGEELRSWQHRPCRKWDNTVLLPSGEVLAVHYDPPEDTSAQAKARSRSLVKLGWDGRLLWSRRVPVHHDVEVTPDGRIALLTYRQRRVPAIHPTILVRDHFITLMSATGETLEEVSMTDLLLASSDVFRFQDIAPNKRSGLEQIDLLHSNSLEWLRYPQLAGRSDLYDPGNVLICMRHQDAIAIVDWSERRAVWAWGQGTLSGPHDATLLPSGNILVFDNGIKRSWSRVLEVDPLEDRIVWEYKAPNPTDFFTLARGASQRLPNGNTLITDSAHGSIFEVTRGGEIVWRFNNPRSAPSRPRSRVVRARRVLEADGAGGFRFERSD